MGAGPTWCSLSLCLASSKRATEDPKCPGAMIKLRVRPGEDS